MTSNVVLCKWKVTPKGLHLWVKGRPSVFGEGATYEQAEEALIEAVMAAATDLDAVVPVVPEYDPPLPATAAAERYLRPHLVMVCGGGTFDFEDHRVRRRERRHEALRRAEERRRFVSTLFNGGICGTCKCGRGGRTSVPLLLDAGEWAVDAGFLRAPFHDSIGVYSDRFLSRLRPDELGRFEFRPITLPRRVRKRRFFELLGNSNVPFVGVKSFDADGVECTECGRRSLHIEEPSLQQVGVFIREFVCRADLPDPLPPCFLVGSNDEPELCLTRERWDELRGRKGTKGVASTLLGVVDEQECDRRPRIRNSFYPCDLCRDWPKPTTIDNRPRRTFSLPTETCSFRNFTWLGPAESRGLIRVSRQTVTPERMRELAQSNQRPNKMDVISFRCARCWRLGRIILDRRELRFETY